MLVYLYIISDFKCLKMLSKVQKFFINLKQTHFFMFAFLIIVLLHAFAGTIAIIVNYKKYTASSFILSLVTMYMPFILLWLTTFLELAFIKKHPKIINYIIFIINSVIIFLQLILTEFAILFIIYE